MYLPFDHLNTTQATRCLIFGARAYTHELQSVSQVIYSYVHTLTRPLNVILYRLIRRRLTVYISCFSRTSVFFSQRGYLRLLFILRSFFLLLSLQKVQIDLLCTAHSFFPLASSQPSFFFSFFSTHPPSSSFGGIRGEGGGSKDPAS